MENTLPVTPTADDLLKDDSVVPNGLYNSILWILCGDRGCDSVINFSLEERISPPDAETHRHVLSICQALHNKRKDKDSETLCVCQ